MNNYQDILVSIIMPIYNADKTLSHCIDCILAQTYKNFELLLIDDGSTDTSGVICDNYKLNDKRVRVFHKKNDGASAARNVGLDNASGEWITFADSDDWVENTWLQDFINHTGEADVIFQNAIWHYQNGETFMRSISVDDSLSYRGQIAELYPRNFLGYIWATAFKTSIINKYNIRFNPQFKFKEDRDFVLRYLKYANSLKILPCRNYHYNFPPTATRTYSIPDKSRVVLEIEEKKNISALLEGMENCKLIINDAPILWELACLYSSPEKEDIKKEVLSLVYQNKPLSLYANGIILIMAIFINLFPIGITHWLLKLIFKYKKV